MDNKIKILVCGDVNGKFKQLFNRVETINKKSGPFEILLCVGEFFGDNNDELIAYKNGCKNASVPTFILGPCNPSCIKNFNDCKGEEICSNVTYLGKRGMYTLSSGVKIAYLSGIESDKSDENCFNESDINSVIDLCFASKANLNDYKGIDILITSQWCKGIMENVNNSSALISYLITQIRPRYHFCGLNKTYFEAAPFRIKSDDNTQLELSTRFIGLADVGNAAKQKYLYAANLIPVEKMRVTDLLQKTTDEINCPFTEMNFSKLKRQSIKNDGGEQFFYDLSEPGNRRELKGRTPYKRVKMEIDTEKCWFCLSSPNVEKHLIVSIGNNFYLAYPKGPLNDYHILILSVTHIQSSSLLTSSDWKELVNFKKSLKKFFKSKGLTTVFFERNYKTAHLQINAIGLDEGLEWKIKHSYEDKSEEYNISFETLPELSGAPDLPQQGPYFATELNDCALLTKDMKRFPLHFAREVICSENLLNCDEKIDWRDCKLSKETETDLVKQFRKDFKPFDITI